MSLPSSIWYLCLGDCLFQEFVPATSFPLTYGGDPWAVVVRSFYLNGQYLEWLNMEEILKQLVLSNNAQ